MKAKLVRESLEIYEIAELKKLASNFDHEENVGSDFYQLFLHSDEIAEPGDTSSWNVNIGVWGANEITVDIGDNSEEFDNLYAALDWLNKNTNNEFKI